MANVKHPASASPTDRSRNNKRPKIADSNQSEPDFTRELKSRPNAVVGVFGLQTLERYGYVDYLDGAPPRDPVFDGMPIHPLLGKDRFSVYITDNVSLPYDSYARALPALRMVTSLLNEPSIMPFFSGILDRSRYQKINHWPKNVTPKTAWYRFMESNNSFDIWDKMARLKNCLRFRFRKFEGEDAGTAMYTTLDLSGPSNGRYGFHDG